MKQGKTEIVYRWLLECFFPFLKIGVSRALSSLSGKTPFSKEILKICFKITNISSDTLLTTSVDISSYPELFFVLRLANAFSSLKPVRLMIPSF